MDRFLLVCLGGAMGAGARYAATGWAQRLVAGSFPIGTLLVNFVGSFLLAFLMQFGLNSGAISPTMRLALATGLLGGFTTYSTFNYETIEYVRQGAYWLGLTNVVLSVVSCLVAGFLGFMTADMLGRS